METKILKGTGIQEKIFFQVKTQIDEISAVTGRVPGIAFIGFEGVPLSKYSIPLHIKAAMDEGFRVYHEIRPADVSFEEVCAIIDKFNNDPEVDAIVILQPVPPHLNPILVEERIFPEKEVEGFHPQNMLGTMIPAISKNSLPMCLPEALIEIFREDGIELRKEAEWLFILDDEFFSNPLTTMIVRAAASKVVPKEAPLTFINKDSVQLQEHCRMADFLVVVSKYPCYVQAEWLKPGVVIIDIYSNLVKEVPSKDDHERLVPIIRGGVNVDSVKGIASAILPIPGGLMTVVLAILFRNTVIAFKRRHGL